MLHKVKYKIQQIKHKKPLLWNSVQICYAALIIQKIYIKYGRDTFIFLMRGETGDTYLYYSYLPVYIEQNDIKKYVLLGDAKGLQAINGLYNHSEQNCISVNEKKALSLQAFFCFIGSYQLKMTHSLMWDQNLTGNVCRMREVKPFTYIDSYRHFLFNLSKSGERSLPIFSSMDKNILSLIKKKKILKGKTVIFAPYAYRIKLLQHELWEAIGKTLEAQGYRVLVLTDNMTEKNAFGIDGIFFTYAESRVILEYAGSVIALRSGFCDIISSANCKKVILYPGPPSKLDYSVHRGDMEFCGLKNMGLSNNAVEIEVPFVKDITNSEPMLEKWDEFEAQHIKFFKQIEKHFPTIKMTGINKNEKKALRNKKKN